MVVWGRLFKTAVIIFHMPGELRSLDALEGSPGDSLVGVLELVPNWSFTCSLNVVVVVVVLVLVLAVSVAVVVVAAAAAAVVLVVLAVAAAAVLVVVLGLSCCWPSCLHNSNKQ